MKRSAISIEKKSGRKMKISPPTNGEPEDDSSGKENGELEEGPPPLTESEWSEDESDNTDTSENKEYNSCDKILEDIETKCNSCTFNVEIPLELEESNQVLINRESGEILIFPKDETKDEEDWIQKSIIERTSQENRSGGIEI